MENGERKISGLVLSFPPVSVFRTPFSVIKDD